MASIIRKLARVEEIAATVPIAGADAIEAVKIQGWQCVAKKGEFKPGDKCVYFEIDAFLPIRPEFEFLRKSSLRSQDGHEGFRLRTVRLRGQLSQGLALPLAAVPALAGISEAELQPGLDVTDRLGVVKWDPPLPANISGEMKGNFPSFLIKTDEERIQNLAAEFEALRRERFYLTEKLDGTSWTCYFANGEFGVCGRNYELRDTEGNAHWQAAHHLGLPEKLAALGREIALQGELIGPGIQGNAYRLKRATVYVFNAFDIATRAYLPLAEMRALCAALSVETVPLLAEDVELPETLDAVLAMADGQSAIAPTPREGIVFRTLDKRHSFKAISNKWLSNEG